MVHKKILLTLIGTLGFSIVSTKIFSMIGEGGEQSINALTQDLQTQTDPLPPLSETLTPPAHPVKMTLAQAYKVFTPLTAKSLNNQIKMKKLMMLKAAQGNQQKLDEINQAYNVIMGNTGASTAVAGAGDKVTGLVNTAWSKWTQHYQETLSAYTKEVDAVFEAIIEKTTPAPGTTAPIMTDEMANAELATAEDAYAKVKKAVDIRALFPRLNAEVHTRSDAEIKRKSAIHTIRTNLIGKAEKYLAKIKANLALRDKAINPSN